LSATIIIHRFSFPGFCLSLCLRHFYSCAVCFTPIFRGTAHNSLFRLNATRQCRLCFICLVRFSMLGAPRCFCLSPRWLLHGFRSWRQLLTENRGTLDRDLSVRLMSAPLLCVLQAFDVKFVFYVAVIVASVLCAVVGDLSLCCRTCIHPR